MNSLDNFSVAILAGGKASRMGTDKAFLAYQEKSFIRTITDEMLKVSDDVVIIIGDKDPSTFASVLDQRVKIANDDYHLQNPMGGMLSACNKVRNSYSAFVACDVPMLRSKVIRHLKDRAFGHSAAVPIWENNNTEPLCAVYNVEEAYSAGKRALSKGKIGCNNLISFMKDVIYVRVKELKGIDPELLSFTNINTLDDMKYLK